MVPLKIETADETHPSARVVEEEAPVLVALEQAVGFFYE